MDLRRAMPAPVNPLTFDPKICNGCNRCVQFCQVDIMIPDPESGKPPTEYTAFQQGSLEVKRSSQGQ